MKDKLFFPSRRRIRKRWLFFRHDYEMDRTCFLHLRSLTFDHILDSPLLEMKKISKINKDLRRKKEKKCKHSWFIVERIQKPTDHFHRIFFNFLCEKKPLWSNFYCIRSHLSQLFSTNCVLIFLTRTNGPHWSHREDT